MIPFLMSACGSSREQADGGNDEGTRAETLHKEEGKEQGSKERTTEAVVKDHRHLDGCLYMLITPEDEKLYPLNLDSAYYEDGLRVRVRYRRKETMTTCMAGTNIEVLAIEKLD
jgi:hypothetical protein